MHKHNGLALPKKSIYLICYHHKLGDYKKDDLMANVLLAPHAVVFSTTPLKTTAWEANVLPQS